ncbi:MAG: hypothetical protein QXP53_02010 [Candidatus Pacearchaeota archaeon]
MKKIKEKEIEIRKETKRSNKFLIASSIATMIIFILGLLLGNYLATSRIERFQETEEMFLIQLLALESRDYFIENFCSSNWQDILDKKISLGQMLTVLEKRLGKDSPKLKNKKEIYELIEIKILELLEKTKKECHEDFNIILFFYTNKKNDPLGSVAGSEDQGLILDQVSQYHNEKKTGRKVYILVFDINSINSASIALRQKYNITKAPSLVINGKTFGYLTKDEIEELL